MKDVIEGLGLTIQEVLIVFIPGIVGLLFLSQISKKLVESASILNMDSTADIITILVATFFLGHVFNVLSSFLDGFYNWAKRKKLKLQENKNDSRSDHDLDYIDLMGDRPFWKQIVFPYAKDSHNLIVKVASLKPSELTFKKNNRNQNFFDAYQYAIRVLMLESSEMYGEVYRYYATARFFRSMVLVFLTGLIISLCENDLTLLYVKNLKLPYLVLSILTLLSLYVFTVQWRKAQHVAFKNFIIYETRKKAIKKKNQENKNI